jgi:poly(beta-D-mannuronate) lyase
MLQQNYTIDMKNTLYILAFLFFQSATPAAFATNYLVKTPAELKAKVEAGLQPNDTVRLANGVWRDADLILRGQGLTQKPIVFIAETAGKVWLEGASSLRLAGEYLVVSGLHFRKGGVAGAVIEYRVSTADIANNCRVTNCVIDDYNGNDRSKESSWIQFYGKNNRLDHCYIGGKKNGGVTLAVNLNDERHRENLHRIDHNVFGHRQPLGSNGGETIRIGVSTYSLTNSKTIVEDNYFYRCSGEVEIISIKSCENIIRRNVFYESEGSLVFRHGHRNIAEGNFFIGNNKPHTGGVRVINEGQKVYNNYFENLKGDRFRSALAVMNGVPNSALNRYNQVKDAVIAFNTFVNCDHILLAAGSDNERTAVPLSTIIAANTIIGKHKNDSIYTAEDDISGISFSDNLVQTNSKANLPKGFKIAEFDGILPKSTQIKPAEAAFVTTDIEGKPRGATCHAGAFESNPKTGFDFQPSKMKDVGTDFFQPDWAILTFPPTRNIKNAPPQYRALEKAVETAEAGDVIELSEADTYYIDAPMLIKKPMTIRAKAGLSARPIFKFKGEKSNFTFISIENGGSLRISVFQVRLLQNVPSEQAPNR